MFGFISKNLKSFFSTVSSKLNLLFNASKIDQTTIQEIEKILLSADTGLAVARQITQKLQQDYSAGKIATGQELKELLAGYLQALLANSGVTFDTSVSKIYLLVGINGSGKTTLLGKLAQKYVQANQRVLIVAGDTFRSAAVQQLEQLVNKLPVTVISGAQDSAPSAVIYRGCEEFKSGKYDILLIDTAGRLQAREDLMRELAKVERVIQKQLPEQKITTLLTIDATLGQNSLDQARIFSTHVKVDGIVLTKMDGAAKGGIALAIVDGLKLPIAYISTGEKLTELELFDAQAYVTGLLSGD
ncbi:MAG TPA: signal recognition particle-docking protein FtsY [Candidatus Babeliales bacterium]|nr:signal recognition particle-docking protein FtsY [Candidatus Babeliales bacterium]